MSRLVRLKVNRFRTIEAGTELVFGPKFNVLLGKNAAGKTSLLELISAIFDDTVDRYGKERNGVDIEYLIENDGVAAEVRASWQRKLATGQGHLVGTDITKPDIVEQSHSVVVQLGNRRFQCLVDGVKGKYQIGDDQESDFDARSDWSAIDSLFLLYDKLKEGQSGDQKSIMSILNAFVLNMFRFDEALVYFDRVRESKTSFGLGKDGLVFDHSLYFPRSLRKLVMDQAAADLDTPSWTFDLVKSGDHFARLLKLLDFTGGHFTLSVEQVAKDEDGSAAKYSFKGLTFDFRDRKGNRSVGSLLSFGQKRLVAFYWYLANIDDDGPAVVDELANGLHHEWITACIDELRERQSFLATQNPLLLDYLPDAGEETTFIRCIREGGKLRWRNFTERESEGLLKAQAVGIQQTSEILKSQELW